MTLQVAPNQVSDKSIPSRESARVVGDTATVELHDGTEHHSASAGELGVC